MRRATRNTVTERIMAELGLDARGDDESRKDFLERRRKGRFLLRYRIRKAARRRRRAEMGLTP